MIAANLYLGFVGVCIAAIIVPGPTNALIMTNGMRHGLRAALLNVFGTQIGLALMLAVVGLGLSSVMALADQWADWLRLIGAAFLIWIGWRMIRGASQTRLPAAPVPPAGGFLLQGLAVSLANPKQLLFFGALLPQFVDTAGDHLTQIAALGATALLLALVSDGAYALASASVGRRLKPAALALVQRVGGGGLILGGVWIALRPR